MSETVGETPSVADLLKLMIEDRQKREEEITQERQRREQEMTIERERREQEMDQRVQEMTRQMELMRDLVEKGRSGTEGSTRTQAGGEQPRLTKLADTDDIEAYLTTFERMMEVYAVEKARWAFLLAPQLTGKAQQAYAAMAGDVANNYDQVKEAILKRYNISEESYRMRFRTITREDGLGIVKPLMMH